jgi:hypothetical protein
MDEQDFRTALRGSMSTATPPPPMAAAPVLDAARRDRTRRRAGLAGAGCAAAVVAIAVGMVVVSPGDPGDPGGRAGTSPSTPPPAEHVAASGPEADHAADLVGDLTAVLPSGFDSGDGASSRAEYENTPSGTRVWSYLAETPVRHGGGTGRLSIEVHEPAPGLSGPRGCGLLPADDCQRIVVAGREVGVFSTVDNHELTRLAGYRHWDGTVVFLRQSTRFSSRLPVLDQLPFSSEELADLATDRRFLD